MKIAVNTRLLLHNKLEGIGRFSFEVLKRIAAAHPEHEFIYLFDRNYHPDFITSPNITPVVISPQARHPLLWKIWFNWAVPRAVKKMEADLFLSPDGFLSQSLKIPQIPVIHDLNFEAYPKDLRPSHSRYYRHNFPKFAKAAKRIVTVSEFSKLDIANRYGIDASKIDVVYNAVSETFKPASNRQIAEFKSQFTDNCNYFLFVGSMHPRKNIERLMLAFDQCKSEHPGSYKLVLAGNKYWWNKQIKSTYDNLKFKADVVFTGRLQDDQLNHALSGAIALTFVPYFEGFGIPILEAFACRCPLITANITAMPGVSGDAALLVNPFSVDEIAGAMIKLQKDENLRATLVEKGTAQLAHFNWDLSAKKLWNSIEIALEKA